MLNQNGFGGALGPVLASVALILLNGAGFLWAPQEGAAWAVGMLAYCLLLGSRSLRRDYLSFSMVLAVIVVHQMLAVYNAFSLEFIGSQADALDFHIEAARTAREGGFRLELGAGLYTNVLAVAYMWLGESLLLGQELSILATTVALVVYVKLLYALRLEAYRLALIALFGLLPSMVVMGSATLREPWEILMLVGSVYLAVVPAWPWWSRFAAIFALCVALSVLHKGLLVYSVFLFLLFLLWRGRVEAGARPGYARTFLYCVALMIPLAGVVYALAGIRLGGEVVRAILDLDVLGYMERYHETLQAQSGRASYQVLDPSTAWAFARTIIPSYLYYMFAPFPWQVEEWVDVYASLESLLRLACVLVIAGTWRVADDECKAQCVLLFLIYVSLTLLWSLGTANYGQAIRHHLLTNWILFLLTALLLKSRRNRAAGCG